MSKAVLSDRLYIADPLGLLYPEIKKKLTYSIPQQQPNAPNIEICDVARLRNIISVPVGRTDLIPYGYEIVDKRTTKPIELPKLNVLLRQSQQEIYEEVNDNCLICADPGFGKTIVGLSLINKFKQKTLILVHTKFLFEQWCSEIRKLYGFEPGKLQAKNIDLDKPIVVSTVQTAIRHIDKIRESFGLIVTDEIHHLPSKTFTDIVNKCKARYKIGLTGTLQRKDGKSVVIQDYISTHILLGPQENVMKPVVHAIHLDEELPIAKDWATRVGLLNENEVYIDVLSRICKVYADKGHKVLCVSDRVGLLKELYELLPESVLITGDTRNRDELIEQLTSTNIFNIMLGSIGIYREGISINQLSCLVLGLQTNNIPGLKQVIGRILRKHPNKLTPIVVDIVLRGNTGYRQYAARLAYYNNCGYIVKDFYNV